MDTKRRISSRNTKILDVGSEPGSYVRMDVWLSLGEAMAGSANEVLCRGVEAGTVF